ncbi:hypothetical protein [uncultured Tateyamaria sp.]|uniref:hypothetical protein n=1 Tax=uncultured Tateyamaria sp. TaxID=455651 RepID=UPI00261FD5DB|nr:hypothetical protein [uncultured Tateyamaria sp.]
MAAGYIFDLSDVQASTHRQSGGRPVDGAAAYGLDSALWCFVDMSQAVFGRGLAG